MACNGAIIKINTIGNSTGGQISWFLKWQEGKKKWRKPID